MHLNGPFLNGRFVICVDQNDSYIHIGFNLKVQFLIFYKFRQQLTIMEFYLSDNFRLHYERLEQFGKETVI